MFCIFLLSIKKQSKRMSKSKGKKDNIRTIVVKQLSEEFKVTPQFVNMVLREERHSDLAQKVLEEYKKRYAAIEAALN